MNEPTVFSRDILIGSMRASVRAGVPLNAAGRAGLMLLAFESAEHARDAIALLPSDDQWDLAAEYLDGLAAVETVDTQPPRSVAAGGRTR